MISEERREALNLLADVVALSPDVRLGQLLAHLGFLGEAYLDRGLGDIDDDELIAVLYRHKAELVARSQGISGPASERAGATFSVSGSSTLPDAAPPAEVGR